MPPLRLSLLDERHQWGNDLSGGAQLGDRRSSPKEIGPNRFALGSRRLLEPCPQVRTPSIDQDLLPAFRVLEGDDPHVGNLTLSRVRDPGRDNLVADRERA